MALVTGFLYTAGGLAAAIIGLESLSMTDRANGLGWDARTSTVGLLLVGALAVATGLWLCRSGHLLRRGWFHALVAGGTALITLATMLSPDASTATAAASIMVFVALDSFFYFAWPAALVHLGVAIAGATWALGLQIDQFYGSAAALGLTCAGIAVVTGALVDRASGASTDDVTGLANRRGFDEEFDDAVRRTGYAGRPLTAALLEIDHFATVREASGEERTHELLRSVVASWLAELPGDAVLARQGRDEFTLLLPDTSGPVGLAVIEQLQKVCPQVSLSGGVTEVQPDETQSALMRRLDRALVEARTAGRAHIVLDDAAPDPLLPELRAGLVKGRAERIGLTVHYQSIVGLADGDVVGVEALARWMHPVLGPISPGRFIPLAEQNGLIGALGTVVLRQACRELAQLHADTGRRLMLTVNVSGHQFCDPAFPMIVEEVLAETGWPAASTVLEVTESLVEADSPVALAALTALQELGVSVAIDDFGTGYSSLARLDTLPANYLKLDHSFISMLTTSTRRARLMSSIMALAESLDLLLIAEGVETVEQAERLRELGCPLAQGYHFHRPSPAATLTELVGGHVVVDQAG